MKTKKVTIKDLEINYSEDEKKKESKISDSSYIYDLKMFDYMLF